MAGSSKFGIATLISVACTGIIGCDDHLSQGDRVVLIDPSSEKVFVDHMPEHKPVDPNMAAYQELIGGQRPTSEGVTAGTEASVVKDDTDLSGDDRDVKVKLLDPPYHGLIGDVKRKYLKRK